jgi:hypothetical protein
MFHSFQKLTFKPTPHPERKTRNQVNAQRRLDEVQHQNAHQRRKGSAARKRKLALTDSIRNRTQFVRELLLYRH